MRFDTLLGFASPDRLRALAGVSRLIDPVLRASFIASASQNGVLAALAGSPASLEQLAGLLGIGVEGHEALRAWLDVGVRSGVLKLDRGKVALGAALPRALARSTNDDVAALLYEVVTLHTKLVLETPARLKARRPFTLSDHDPTLVARSSRVVDGVIGTVLRDFIPPKGNLRLLEIGCGSGVHVRSAAALNPELQALALELSAAVADRARENFADWGLSERAEVRAGDIRELAAERVFDRATLHQNIYYFPVAERVRLLEHVRGFLVPGGRLMITTGCPGRTPAMAVLSLWGAVTEGCGPLPEPDELVAQLEKAGFSSIQAENLLAPVERFYAFTATAPG